MRAHWSLGGIRIMCCNTVEHLLMTREGSLSDAGATDRHAAILLQRVSNGGMEAVEENVSVPFAFSAASRARQPSREPVFLAVGVDGRGGTI